MNSGDDLLAILVGDNPEFIRVEHPFYVKFNPLNGSLGALPYCNLTDETYFELAKTRIDFVALASEPISRMFLDMATKYSNAKAYIPNEEEEEEPLRRTQQSVFVEGNDTKH
jgi:hypothetical protein